MDGRYIYNPPPPPPSSSGSSNNNSTRGNRGGGGGPRRGGPRGGSLARNRPRPYNLQSDSNTVAAQRGSVQQDYDENNEEKAGAGSQQPVVVVVPGNNKTISVNTEKEIEEWIQARKKNWPTNARVEAKQKEREAANKQREEASKQREEAGKPREEVRGGSKGVCKFFAKNGKCSNGTNCRFAHTTSTGADQQQAAPSSKVNYKRYEAPVKMPLFKMLVRNDIDQENGSVLDFIEFLSLNGLLE